MLYRKALSLLIGSILFIVYGAFAQEQKIADSLAKIYGQKTLADTAKFELLTDLSFNEVSDLKKGLHYAEELIRLSRQAGNNRYLRVGYFLKGTKERLLGNLDEALAAYFKSAEIARQAKQFASEGEAYGAIADIYAVADNHTNAIDYYHKAITTLRQSKGDSVNLASVLSNAGDAYLNIKLYDSALLYFNEAKLIFDRLNYQSGRGYSLGNIGMVYANVGKNDLAEKNINEAIQILQQAGDYYPICVYLISMADVYVSRGENQTALRYTHKSLQLAEQYELKEQIADASRKLSELYEKAGNTADALRYYKKHIAFRDSLNNINTVQRLADLRTNYELSKKQAEVNLLNKEKQNQQTTVFFLFIILGLTLLLLVSLYWSYKSKSREKMRGHQQELLNAKLEIQEQTYRNISQELHDNIGQVLSLVKINLNSIDMDETAASKEKLVESEGLLNKVIRDIRDLSKTLHTDFINEIGLSNAVEQQLLLLKRTGVYATQQVVEGEVYDYEPGQELLIFRIVQELLNNIVKHAGATSIVVSMKYEVEKLVIRVSDNGKGFDQQASQAYPNKGLGLRNVQNRLRLIKGALSFETEPQKGTTAVVEIQK